MQMSKLAFFIGSLMDVYILFIRFIKFNMLGKE